MKKRIIMLAAAMTSLLWSGSFAAEAKDAPVKREMRSAWVATVWRLDWPQNVISSTGNQSQIDRQKRDMTALLDSMERNNMNAINFQVRGRCDAFYKSSFEPWSSDLVSERGLDPGWDPLEWVVEECHKRGIECHAWLNPYRYESVKGQWDGTPQAYRAEHPDWLMDVTNSNGTASILNPGKQEVTDRICDVIEEIVRNYDIDGVLFDDYFYLSGTPMSMDADLYNDYKAKGGTLSQADWRRDNVNRMVAAVYKRIKQTKPWVRFGISPAGIACTSSSVAKKYGISPCPTGSDWQYNDIYSDPIAWISQQSLDYISPQIYWTIGYSTDYKAAAKWWSTVAHKWNRHFYSSHSISSLTAASKAPGMSGRETDISISPMASGPNNTTFEEYANEIRLNREFNLDDAPGSIFYSVKYMYRTAPLFAHSLLNSVFNTKALVPAATWQAATNPGIVKNFARTGSKLSWDAYDNMRYTVYAFPSSMPVENFTRDSEYLLKVVYGNQYDIPAKYLSGYQFAVCVLDRYGNEYSPAVLGAAAKDLPAPTLVSPVGGQTIEDPFDFKWNAVEGASEYIVDVASDAAMTEMIGSRSSTTASISSEEFPLLPVGPTLYWRVRACGTNYNDGISATAPFVVKNMVVTYPENGAADIPLTVEIKNSIPDRNATIQLAKIDTFDEIAYTAEGKGTFAIPKYALEAATTYYVRFIYSNNGAERISPVSSFTTLEVPAAHPSIAFPVNGGELHADQHVRLSEIEGPFQLRLEICANTNFSARVCYIASSFEDWCDIKTGGEMKISSKSLVDGTTYYARTRATYRTIENGAVNSEYSEPIAFVYRASESGIDSATTGSDAAISIEANGTDTPRIIVGVHADDVKVFTASGATVAVLATDVEPGTVLTPELGSGIYIVRAGNAAARLIVR